MNNPRYYKITASGKGFQRMLKFLKIDCKGKFDPASKSWAVTEIPKWLNGWEDMEVPGMLVEVNLRAATHEAIQREMDRPDSDL